MRDMKELSLSTICDGAAVERFDYELQRVLENILDPNTEAKEPREITLKVKIKPTEDREIFQSTMKVTSKLAGLSPVIGTGIVSKDINGKAEAHEYAHPKQQELDFENSGKVTPMTKGGQGS